MKTQRVPVIVLTSVMLFVICIVTTAGISHGGAVLNSALHRAVVTEAPVDIPVEVTVVVKDTEGHAIRGARIVVHQSFIARWINPVAPPDYEKETGLDGIARISVNAKAGENLVLSFEISKENMQTETRRAIDLGKDFTKPLRELKFTLKPLVKKEEEEKLKPEETTTLKIKVIRKDTGKGVQGAKVEVWVEAFPVNKLHTAYTDLNGDAVVVTKASDNFDVIASKELLGKSEKKIRNNLKFEKEIEVDLELEKPKGSVVSVTVRDVDTRLPVKDATVILDSKLSPGYYYESTGDSGTANLVIPEGGTFSVRIKQDFYEQLSGAEIKVLESEDPQAFKFEVKAKPKKGEIGNSVDVTVLQGDRIAKIQRTNLPLPDASIRIEQFGLTRGSGLTDRSGEATITTDLEGEVQVVVEAEGYKKQVKTVRMANEGRYGKAHAATTLVMQPSTAEDIIEVTVLSAGKRSEDSVPLAGVKVMGGEESTTTNAYGVAKLRGTFKGNVEVAVEKSGYLSQSKKVNASGGKGSARFTLQLAPDEDTVSVTIMGEDPKGGSPSPIAGAHITANGISATTDRSGHAVITGSFENGVAVKATANDFNSQVQQVSITQPQRTGVANFLLQPKDALSLIIEVRTGANQLLPGVLIDVYPIYKAEKTLRLGTGTTDSAGEASIEFKGSASRFALIRSGLTLKVSRDTYATKLTDVIPESLPRVDGPIRLTVYLERDWSALEAAIDALEAKVHAWHNEYTGQSKAGASNPFVDKAQRARARAEELMLQFRAAGLVGTTAPSSPADSHCRQVTALQQDILDCKNQANGKSLQLRQALENGTSGGAKCSSPAEAEAIRSSYRKAIRLAAEIGALNKKAVKDRDQLLTFAKQTLAIKDLGAELQSKLAQIGQQATLAEEAAQGAAAYNRRLADVSRALVTRQIGLNAELAVLTVKFAPDAPAIPLNLTKRIQAMEGLLRSARGDTSFGAQPAMPESIIGAVAAINGLKATAQELIGHYNGGACEVDTLDAMVDGINTTLTNASFDIGLAADLPRLADDCVKGVAKDNGQGKSEETSDNNNSTGKGDRAATGTDKNSPPILEDLPEDKITSKTPEPKTESEGGFWSAAKAGKKDVDNKVTNKTGSKTNNPAPTVEELPEDRASANTASNKTRNKSKNSNPTAEDLPEDRASTNTASNKTGNKTNNPAPTAEDLPEDRASTNTASNKTRNKTNNPAPTAEDLPEDRESTNKWPGTTSKPSGSSSSSGNNQAKEKPKKEKKPRDPNKPDIWTVLGGVAREAITGQPNPGVVNNPGGNTNPGTNTNSNTNTGGGGNPPVSIGSDYEDLTGTWVMAGKEGDEYWRTQMVLRRTSNNTWQGQATFDTSFSPCSADYFVTPGFKGSVTAILTAPGVFTLILREVIECGSNKGQQSEVRWPGTFAGSQMSVTLRDGHNYSLTRQ